MPLLNISEYAPYIHKVLSGHLKPIAYGVSPVVNLAYPLRPAYFISAEPVEELPEIAKKFWHHKPLDALAQEDPAKTVIIICNGQEEDVWKAVSAFGDFPVIRFFAYEFFAPYLPTLANLPKTYRRERKKTSAKRSIVIRGRINHENQFLSIQKLAYDHPEDYIVVSTWDNTPAQNLGRLQSLCDHIVTSAHPVYGGSQNRNIQMILAQRGIAAALESGAEKLLITRSDIMLTKASTLDGFDWMMDKFPLRQEVQKQQKGRIIIPNLYTRRFIPYSASDLMAYGWTEDVASFWNASVYDDRPDDSPAYLDRGMATSLDSVTRNKTVVESFFWINYMEKINRPPLYTLADWMAFLKDYLLVVDMQTQRILWNSKNFHDHSALAGRYKTCISANDWAELFYSSPPSFPNIDLKKVTWEDFVNSP